MDMDGTLLNPWGEISPRSAAALRRAQAAGVRLAIISGRSPGNCARFALETGLVSCGIAGLNGTQVWETPNGRELFCSAYPPDVARACWRVLRQADCPVTLYTRNGQCRSQWPYPVDALPGYRKRAGGDGPAMDEEPGAISRGLAQTPLKFVSLFGQDAAGRGRHAAVRAALAWMPEVWVTTSAPGVLEVMQLGIGKGQALARLAAHWGIAQREVMALGDYDNDVEMLAWAGLGVAMGNASPAARRAARIVTATNAQDGLAQAVEQALNGELYAGV
ncbi:MAG: Cof-type HAD-IIB family hydrolase [Oscillospiraceae bacterium]|jgi:Cof subfamily protein (haloacid dehalogenase superfamily)|nr:Cof-type HAD-IIB family hydrolase [Oscillospiraceae bacterium]